MYSKHPIVPLALLHPITTLFKQEQKIRLFNDHSNLCLTHKCETSISPETATGSDNLYNPVDVMLLDRINQLI